MPRHNAASMGTHVKVLTGYLNSDDEVSYRLSRTSSSSLSSIALTHASMFWLPPPLPPSPDSVRSPRLLPASAASWQALPPRQISNYEDGTLATRSCPRRAVNSACSPRARWAPKVVGLARGLSSGAVGPSEELFSTLDRSCMVFKSLSGPNPVGTSKLGAPHMYVCELPGAPEHPHAL